MLIDTLYNECMFLLFALSLYLIILDYSCIIKYFKEILSKQNDMINFKSLKYVITVILNWLCIFG